jgi:release factor glutamine methyltransferase
MKYFPAAKVAFGEIDPAHEATIRENIRINDLNTAQADVHIGDLFAPFLGEKFDVIAVNPPYIPTARELPSSVTDYEPALALRAGADGLAVIRRIADELGAHLAPGGTAWIECDIENIEAARRLFEKNGFTATILDDQYARPRVLVVRYTDSACATSSST